MILFTLFIFPPLVQKLGYIHGFNWGMFLFAAFSVGVMVSPLFCDIFLPPWFPFLPVLLLMTSCAKMASCMAFTCTFLLINASVASKLRGSVNGLAMTFGSIAKALGPSIGSILFAASIQSSIPLPLSYLLVFLISLTISILTLILLPIESLSEGLIVSENSHQMVERPKD